jgi:lipopolysaccharide transport system permease protein
VVAWQGFGFGLGLLLGTVNVFFRDVGQIMTVVLQIWMWSVPIIYLEDMLPTAYRATLPFNPVYPFVSAFRSAILDSMPPPWIWAAMLGWALVAVLVGSAVLAALRSEIRDVL